MKLLSDEQQKEIISKLKTNKIVILPTDTIYGISAVVSDDNKFRINKIKNSPSTKDLIILISDVKQANAFVDLDSKFINMISKEMTTVIYKKENSQVSYGIRMVNRKDIKNIISETGPIYSTSVNLSKEKYLVTNRELEMFSDDIDSVYFVGELNNEPSKIYNLLLDKYIR